MARAKKTDRAEARRRARAAAAEAAGDDATTGAPAASAKATTATSARVGAPPAARPEHRSTPFRGADPAGPPPRGHPGDLPWLITRTPAVARAEPARASPRRSGIGAAGGIARRRPSRHRLQPVRLPAADRGGCSWPGS